MKLAERSKLRVPRTELMQIEGSEFLLIERYDRICQENRISRIHQEDFCQALGVLSDFKYQNDGGPSIADICDLLKTKTSIPLLELRAFLQYVLFNFIIGNCDAHGKNYSLILQDNFVKLAPIYDTVCTLIYPNLTQKLSMKIGKHVEIKKVNCDDFAILAEQFGLKPKIVVDTYCELVEKVSRGLDYVKADPALSNHGKTIDDIERNLLNKVAL